MAGGYSVLNALNKATRQQAEEKPGGRFRTRDIEITDIYPNGNNFYAMQDVEVLAEDIKAVGLLENLTVMYAPADGKNYKLLGGERRWRALNLLVEQGYREFSQATCQIRTAENERAEIIEIIMCNRQRVKTVWEQIEEERRLKETLQAMKKNGETLKGYNLQEGRLRDTIAAILNYSAAKVGQMETIAGNLCEELREALKDEKINFSTAYTVAKMDNAGQQAALEAYRGQGTLNSAQAKEAEAVAKGAENREQDAPTVEADLTEYGTKQMNVESICYRCAHWSECLGKSSTTVKCATFRDKNRDTGAKPPQEDQTKEEQDTAGKGVGEQEYTEQSESPQARVVDTGTGEVYENMQEAEKAAETPQDAPKAKETEQATKERVHMIRLAATDFDDVVNEIRTFDLRKNDRDYKVGDILDMSEFREGRFTGRTIRCRVTYMLQGYTGLADGYCILGVKVV